MIRMNIKKTIKNNEAKQNQTNTYTNSTKVQNYNTYLNYYKNQLKNYIM
jgi:hypothetical protein